MFSGNPKDRIREVILAPKKGEKVPSPLSGREDLENRVQLSELSGVIPEVRDSIADCLRTERETGKPSSYLRVLMLKDRPSTIVFISRSFHAELQRVAFELFSDKNGMATPDLNLLRLNKWLQQKVISLLIEQGLKSDQSVIELA